MINNVEALSPTVFEFARQIEEEEFVVDRTGCKMVEIIGFRLELGPDPVLDFGKARKTPMKYVEKELAWYYSQDLNINFIFKS